MYVLVYIYIYVYMYVLVYMYICMYLCTRIYVCTRIYRKIITIRWCLSVFQPSLALAHGIHRMVWGARVATRLPAPLPHTVTYPD